MIWPSNGPRERVVESRSMAWQSYRPREKVLECRAPSFDVRPSYGLRESDVEGRPPSVDGPAELLATMDILVRQAPIRGWPDRVSGRERGSCRAATHLSIVRTSYRPQERSWKAGGPFVDGRSDFRAVMGGSWRADTHSSMPQPIYGPRERVVESKPHQLMPWLSCESKMAVEGRRKIWVGRAHPWTAGDSYSRQVKIPKKINRK
jgi:hypothetical protein